jgi:hypothetical protein
MRSTTPLKRQPDEDPHPLLLPEQLAKEAGARRYPVIDDVEDEIDGG